MKIVEEVELVLYNEAGEGEEVKNADERVSRCSKQISGVIDAFLKTFGECADPDERLLYVKRFRGVPQTGNVLKGKDVPERIRAWLNDEIGFIAESRLENTDRDGVLNIPLRFEVSYLDDFPGLLVSIAEGGKPSSELEIVGYDEDCE